VDGIITGASSTTYAETGITSTYAGSYTIVPTSGQDLAITLATTGDFVVNTDDFFIDTSEGKIGINDATPSFELDVNGDVQIQGGELYITAQASSASTTEGTIYYDTDHNLYVYTDTGWVDLTVQGGSYSAGSGLTLATTTFKLGGTITEDTSLNLYGSLADRDLRFYNSDSGDELLFMDGSTGRIGIGTTAPDTLLDIEGTNTTNAWIQIRNSGASGRVWDLGEKDTGIFSIGSDMAAKVININGTSGNVGIGTTDPASALHILSSTAAALQIDPFGAVAGNTGELRFLELAASGTNYVGFKSPDAITTNNIYTLPDAFPGSSKVLQSTSGGVLTWEDAGGASLWTDSGPDTYLGTGGVPSTDNVGIGTTDPQDKLEVKDGNFILTDADVAHGITDFAPTNAFAKFSPNSGTDGGLDIWGVRDTNSASALTLRGLSSDDITSANNASIMLQGARKTGTSLMALSDTAKLFTLNNFATEVLTILGNGNVGIGTTAPASLLDVYSSTAHPILSITGAHATDYDPMIQFLTDASPTVKFSLGVDSGDSDKFKIYSGSGIGGTSEFMIDTSGVTTISNLKMGELNFPDDAGIVSWVDMAVSDTPPDNTVESYTAYLDGNPMITVYGLADSAGAVDTLGVGIGITNPAYKFDVFTDTASSYAANFFNDGANVNRYGVRVQGGADDCSTTGTCQILDYFDGDGTASGGLRIVTGTVAIFQPSDSRLKTNISDTAINGLEIITGLRVADFRRNSGGDLGPLQTGFIAQEAQGIYPAMVSPSPDGYLAISDGLLMPVVVKAIQEQSGEISGISDVQNNLSQGLTSLGLEIQNSNDQILQLSDETLTVNQKIDLISANLTQQNDILNQISTELGDKAALLPEDQLKLETLGNDIYGMMAALASQMEIIKEENKAMLDFYLAFELGNFLMKDASGNLDLLGGKLEAEGVVAGAFTVKVKNDGADTTGEYVICPAMTEADANGNCTVAQVDADLNNLDDNTGNPINDGKLARIKTKASNITAKVYVTPLNSTANQVLYIGERTAGESFEVKVDNAVSEAIKFNWWIVETR
jgi:hypothetical protein